MLPPELVKPVLIAGVALFVMSVVDTLAYGVRTAGVFTRRLAISLSLFNILVTFSRFSNMIQAPFLGRMADDVGITLGDGSLDAAQRVFAAAAGKRAFGNARFARSLFEQAYARMATRAATDGAITVDELTTLLAEDIDDDLSGLASERRRIGF